jgi:8-oxo-dGTP pyrophosphatase MutT (NUDIX family)
MKQHFLTPSAVQVVLLRQGEKGTEILLQRRQNTGFADGLWDISFSGHVEDKESMKLAAVREAKEELDITISPENLEFMLLVHKRDEECNLTYYNGYFLCKKYEGVPHICEREKCSEIAWFALDRLPDDLIDDRRKALACWQSGGHYLEYGWN